MPGKITTALGNVELKKKQNKDKEKNQRARELNKATKTMHPKKTKTGGGKTRKGRKVRKTRKGRR